MSGEVSGLQRRMRHVSPFCLYMNCRNHRLALCLKHLMKEYPLLVDADSVLAIWKLFHYSPQRFHVFKTIQEVYGNQPITLIRAASTRWLSHGQAAIRFIDLLQSCLDALDQIYERKKEPEVFGLRSSVTNKNTVLMILLLCDVLKPVSVLSMCLQEATINFMDIDTKVKATTNELEHLLTLLRNRDTSMYFSKAADIFSENDERTDLQRRMRNYGNLMDPHVFLEQVGMPFINSLIGEITDAFSCNPVFRVFGALDPRQLPENVNKLAEFGMVQMDTLIQHYTTEKEDKSAVMSPEHIPI